MDIEILHRFCNPDNYHKFVQAPFSAGDYTYATEGHIIIRVPRLHGVGEAEDAPKNLKAMFDEVESRVAPIWRTLPEFQISWLACPSCKGSAHTKNCPRINTDGCWRGNHHSCERYDEDCAIACEPKARGAKPCENCEGTGRVKGKTGLLVEGSVSEVKVGTIYLDLMSMLPGIMYAPYDEASPLRLKFDGGDGLLMPMRMD